MEWEEVAGWTPSPIKLQTQCSERWVSLELEEIVLNQGVRTCDRQWSVSFQPPAKGSGAARGRNCSLWTRLCPTAGSGAGRSLGEGKGRARSHDYLKSI